MYSAKAGSEKVAVAGLVSKSGGTYQTGSYDLIRYLLHLIAELSGCLQKEHIEHKEVVTDLDW